MASTTLAMIVRNEAANLPDCLESVRGLFDDTIVVDTGSTDDTVRIARRFGATVLRFPWCDDFSAARNFGLDRVRTDYVFRLDADDRLPDGQRKRMRRLLDSLPDDRSVAYAFRVHSIDHGGMEAYCDEHRLWPNLPMLRFRGRVHERVQPERDAPRVPVRMADVRLEHRGYADADVYRAKLLRNLRLLECEVAARPNDALVHFDLGRTRSALGSVEGAIADFERFFKLRTPLHAMTARVAYRRIVEIHRSVGDLKAAMVAAQRGLAAFPDDAVMVGYVAAMFVAVENFPMAREGYEHALRLYRPDRPDNAVAVDFRSRILAALAALPNP